MKLEMSSLAYIVYRCIRQAIHLSVCGEHNVFGDAPLESVSDWKNKKIKAIKARVCSAKQSHCL